MKSPWTINVHLRKENEGQEGKINLFQEWVPVRGGGHKERRNEGEYGWMYFVSIYEIRRTKLLKLF
jgi:hypothetical protein